MFEVEQHKTEMIIRRFFDVSGFDGPQVQWVPTPFAGQWGISTSFFQAASQEARQKNTRMNVPARAQEMAQTVADMIGPDAGFERVEAVKGYLNLYFKPGEFAHRVINHVMQAGEDFGRGEPKNRKVMVEYAQLNTHKTFMSATCAM